MPPEWRSFERDGESFRAWQIPAAGEPRGIVIVLPDVHGVGTLYPRLATRFTEAGFDAAVLDPYSREGAPELSSPEEAVAFVETLPDARILGDVEHLVAELGQGRFTAVSGFCVGGQLALEAACLVGGIDATVAFYGMLRHRRRSVRRPAAPLDLLDSLRGRVLAVFGEEDPLIPRQDVDDLRARARELGFGDRVAIRTYPGCGHAFLNDERPSAYRAEAAEDAWAATLEFLTSAAGVP